MWDISRSRAKQISERSRMNDPIDAPTSDSITTNTSWELVSGMGKLRLDSHETYIEEMEEEV